MASHFKFDALSGYPYAYKCIYIMQSNKVGLKRAISALEVTGRIIVSFNSDIIDSQQIKC